MRAESRVLVLDADMVPALTIARSLARRGCRVDCAAHDVRPIAGYSRHVAAVFRYPDPLARADDFVRWLTRFCAANDYRLVLPVTERTLAPLSQQRGTLGDMHVAMPAARSLDCVLDKSRTMALAEELGVPVPGSITVSDLGELSGRAESLRYPVVMKPARSIGSRDGGASHLQVSYAFDAIGLVTGCAHALRFGPVLLQEYFPGDGVGIELVAREGEILYSFQHRRLHEVPLTGGGSSLRKSEVVDPALLEASANLVRALEWNGVAMVEFKQNPATGEFCLMEVNGRFWGSLPLAAAAGADFPSMLLDLELTGEVPPAAPYRTGVFCRLLSRDLMWYESVLRGNEDDRLVQLPSRGQVLRGLLLFLHPRHHLDVQSLRDPLPGLVDLGRIGAGYSRRLRALMAERWFRFRQRRAWRRGRVAAALESAGSMLFLCYGNINRSALADVLVRGYAEDAGIEVYSAGLYPEEGRPADPVMKEIAADNGIDMSALRSKTVDANLLRSSDIIFVMEKRHYDRLLEIQPEAAGRIFLLGAHAAARGAPAEIADPFGQSREAYLRCFRELAEAVDQIKALIALRESD